ncbi:protein DEEPER ROOTING 1-like [Tasmannia lanceolata]|uniref:protein DEEPER ROOTING 1-like n=1 Tax=Tasmannia lanceolata TaxID=3420 RepID=UPI004064B264
MRILNWMQNKINGRQGSKKSTMVSTSNYNMQEARQEEFSDWSHGLLTIGTFGNNQLMEDTERPESSDNSHPYEDLSNFTAEEVGKLQEQLTKLLSLKPVSNAIESRGEIANLPLDKFLNCPSSLEVDRTNCQRFCDDVDKDDGSLSRSTSIILSKSKEVCTDNSTAIRQRSLSFLLKKMFVCRGGFAAAPSLRDQLPETRMEKLLRAIIHKKIYPQSSASKSTKKYLGNKQTCKTDIENQTQERADDGCKWVKTDSDFIVLEI